MENFTADVVIHRRTGDDNQYLPVSRKAQDVFATLSNDTRRPVPCRGGKWFGTTLRTPAGAETEERVKATLAKDFDLTVGEALPESGI